MSHRIDYEEARRKLEHEKDVLSRLKQGYKSDRIERRKQKRLQHEKSWFEYIKGRGGIKEPKKSKEQQKLERKEEVKNGLQSPQS